MKPSDMLPTQSCSNAKSLRDHFHETSDRMVERGVFVSTATRRATLLGNPTLSRNGRVCAIRFKSHGGGVWVATLGGLHDEAE